MRGATLAGSVPRSSGDRCASYAMTTRDIHPARRPRPLDGGVELVRSPATTRGATRAKVGSAKWARSGSSQSARRDRSTRGEAGSASSIVGVHPASTNATRGVATSARPRLRAAAGPAFVGRRTSRTGTVPLTRPTTSAIADGSRDPSSTTITSETPVPAAASASSECCSRTGSSNVGITTVTSDATKGPAAGAGWAMPRSTRRATTAGEWTSRRSTGSAKRSTVSGEPPTRTRPSSRTRSDRSGRRRPGQVSTGAVRSRPCRRRPAGPRR